MTNRTDLGLTANDAGGCRCASHSTSAESAAQAAGTHPAHRDHLTVDYLVTGMTCEHCVASVTEEVSAIAGVDGVTVRLNVGGESLISVRGAAAADRSAVAAAIDEAGYALAGQ